jgi:hypothetical protein
VLQPPGSVATMSICYCPIQLDRVQLVTARYPSRWLESSTRLDGFRALKKTPEAPYTTKVNYREHTSRGPTLGSDALREKHDTDSDTDAIPTLIQLLVEGVSATM